MSNEQQRHDISDAVWSLLEPHLPGQRGQWGGIAQDNRRFINGVFWILRTGAPVSYTHLECHYPCSFVAGISIRLIFHLHYPYP